MYFFSSLRYHATAVQKMHLDLATPTVWVFLLASRLPVPEAWSPSGFRPIVCYPFSTRELRVLLFSIQDNERKPIVLKPRGCKTCPVTSTHIQLIKADWGTCHFICREPETETLEHLRMCWLFFSCSSVHCFLCCCRLSTINFPDYSSPKMQALHLLNS